MKDATTETSAGKQTENTKLNTIISTIVSFILSIILTLICYMMGTYFGLFNKALLLDAMNKSSFYEGANYYTIEQASDYAIPAGLDETIFEDVFTLQNTYNEGKANLVSTLNGERYRIDTDYVNKKLHENINSYIVNKGYHEGEYDQESIDAFVDKICVIYANNLSLPYLSYYNGIKNIFTKVMIIGMPVLVILAAFAVFLLIKIHKWLHRALRYVAYSFLGAALMTSIMPTIVLLTKRYQYLNISPAYYNKILSRYLGQSLLMYLYVAFVMLSSALIIITLVYYRRKQLTK